MVYLCAVIVWLPCLVGSSVMTCGFRKRGEEVAMESVIFFDKIEE